MYNVVQSCTLLHSIVQCCALLYRVICCCTELNSELEFQLCLTHTDRQTDTQTLGLVELRLRSLKLLCCRNTRSS